MAFFFNFQPLWLHVVAVISLLATRTYATNAPLPVVDLGYTHHQAISYNTSGLYYNFSSIRYAQPPLGELRFSLPIPPTGRSPVVTNGSEGRQCPQSLACWFGVQTEFLTANLSGKPFNFDASYQKFYGNDACDLPAAEPSPMESEDCLFLDVIVPKMVYDGFPSDESFPAREGGAAPVLVYFQDGGFVGGWKEQYSPAGLIRESLRRNGTGMIYVGFNYRLGAFGWLSGSSYKGEGGLVNAGLHDQRLVLDWVQKNIRLFGGDPGRVTVMGESSGGSSLMMQLTAYNNNVAPPFQRIITQSPAMEPASKTPENQEQTYRKFLGLINASSLAEARQKSSQEVINANNVLVKSQPYGSSAIGPANDGNMVPADPKILMRRYINHYNISSMTTYASNEAGLIASANITSESDFTQYISLQLAAANATTRAYFQNELYPPVYNGTYPYTTLHERAKLFWSELVTMCNPNIIHRSTSTTAGWATGYMVPPAIHLSDTPSIFWNGPGTDSSVNEEAAIAMQQYIINFVARGDPNEGVEGGRLPKIPRWGGGTMLGLGTTGLAVKEDITLNKRCEFISTAPWNF